MQQRRKLGLWMATALVIGNVIGSGIFLLPSSLAHFGGLGLLSWGFTAGGAIFLALVFARLCRRFPQVGGPYAYSRFAFGDFVGFQVAWGYWLAVWISTAALIIAAVSYLSVLFPILAESPLLAMGVGIGFVWFFTLVNALGAHFMGTFQIITTIFKLLPILFVIVFGWFFVSFDHFVPFNLSGEPTFQVLTSAASLTLFAFIGLESATVPAEDVENPGITIPRATIIGTVIAAVAYILSTAAIMGIVPAEQLAQSGAPFVLAIQHMIDPAYADFARVIVVLSAVVSCLGATNGWILLQAQVPYAAALDKLFPKSFARLSSRNVPLFGLIFSSVLLSLFLLLSMSATLVEQFNLVIVISTFTMLMPYAYSSLAELGILVRDRSRFDKRKFLTSFFISLLAFLYSLWAIAGCGEKVVYLGGLFLLLSAPVYTWIRWRYTQHLRT